jgi:glucose-6-phosphate 1-dehydrogenase
VSAPHSDAFVFFGATGDLAYKKIFPALQAMVRRGHFDMPVIGKESKSTVTETGEE